ncbi:MAG: hypothetical protein U0869_11000 [Chloroflexota bacterium]
MRVVRAAAWVVLLLVGAFAAAGLVLALDHPATDDGRPELTAADAAVLAPRLAALEPVLTDAATDAQDLAAAASDVLVGLRALDPDGVSDALLAGDVAAGGVGMAADRLRTEVPELLHGLGDGSRLPAADRQRAAAIAAVPSALDVAAGAWGSVGVAVEAPTRLLAALADHDAAIARAAALGRAGDYAGALAQLETATAALARAAAVRDAATAAGRDTAALAARIAATEPHDGALRSLYRVLRDSGGVRTDRVDAAIAAERAAAASTPDPADLPGILDDLGGRDIPAALLPIEAARGAVAAALGPAPSPGG